MRERARIIRPIPGPISKITPPAALSVISQTPGVTVEELLP